MAVLKLVCAVETYFCFQKKTVMQFVVKNDCITLLEPLKLSKVHLVKISMTVSMLMLDGIGLLIQAIQHSPKYSVI